MNLKQFSKKWQERSISKYFHLFSFCTLILLIAFKYEYNEIAFKGPQSIHSWRQAQGAVQALCYYENGMEFFKPCSFNLHNDNGYAAAEFPIVYYVAAGMYHIFGHQEWILRSLHFLILAIGLYCVSAISLFYLRNLFLSLLIPVSIFGAPMMVFYGFNFLPNIPALGFLLIGSYFYWRFIYTQKKRHFFGGLAFIALAGLIKISFLIPLIALFGIYVLSLLPPLKDKVYKNLFPPGFTFPIAFVAVFAIVIGWILWTIHFNEYHQSDLFLAKTRPIWEMIQKDLDYTWYVLRFKTYNYFFPYETCLFFLGVLILLLFNYKKIRWEAHLFTWLVTFGGIAYLLLFFKQLTVHNYYFIDIMMAPLLILFMLCWVVKSLELEKKLQYLFYILLALLINNNINMSYFYNHKAYEATHPDMKHLNSSFFKKQELQQFLTENGVAKDDKVVTFPDHSPSTTLYYLNREGWSELFIRKNFQNNLSGFHKRGAKWLILSNLKDPYSDEVMAMFKKSTAAFDNSIFLYSFDDFIEAK